jgi:hypothetical protein
VYSLLTSSRKDGGDCQKQVAFLQSAGRAAG